MPSVPRNGRRILVPGIVLLLATAVFVGCLMACSTFWQSLTVTRDLARAGCTVQQALFNDGTASQDTDPGTLTLYCDSDQSARDTRVAVPPEVLDSIIWREAPVNLTKFDDGYFSLVDISADQLRAQLGPRPPGLGTTRQRDALLYLSSWIAFLNMGMSSIFIARRVRFGWLVPVLVFLVPVAMLTYITLSAGGGLATLNLAGWLFQAMVPYKWVVDAQLMIFLAVLALGSMPVIVVVRQRRG
jgi:hypothetical protein